MAYSTKSVVFNGIDGYVDFGDVSAFRKEYTDSFSVSCWAKTTSILPINTIIAKMNSSSGIGYAIYLNNYGQLEATLKGASTARHVRTNLLRYNDGGWHHFVMSYDGSSVPILYVDGIAKDTTIVQNDIASSILVSNSFQIGACDATNMFAGSIDEVAFFNSELSAGNVLSIFASAVPTNILGMQSLAAWWQLGEDIVYPQVIDMLDSTFTFPIIVDQSLNGNTGTMMNMEEADVVFDAPGVPLSVYFDGVDDYITMGNVLGFEYNLPFSISLWFRSITTVASYFIAKMGGDPDRRGYGCTIKADGTLELLLRSDDTSNKITVTTLDSFNDGLWHHVVWCYSGSSLASGCTCYVDNLLRSLTVNYDGLTATIVTTDPLILGARTSGTAAFYAGILDEVAVYNRTLTATEVAWIYNSGKPQDLSLTAAPLGLVAWWRMGEWYPMLWTNPYPTIYDASGNGNGGTMTNMVSNDVVTDTPGGVSGHSLDFSGATNEEVIVSTGSNFYSQNPFSVAFWCKSNVTTTSNAIYKDGTSYASWNIRAVQASPTSYVNWNISDRAANSIGKTTSAAYTVMDGNWHHIVCTYSGNLSHTGLKIYIDGAPTTTLSSSGTLTTGSLIDGPLYLGSYNGSVYWRGKLDEVAVYAKELSAAEVAWVYNSGAPRMLNDTGAPTNLDGWWRMGDDPPPLTLLDSGPSAVPNDVRDLSGSNYTGTMVGMATTDVVYDAPGRGQCAYFEAASGHEIAISYGGGVKAYERTDRFSVSFWAKYTASGCVCSKINAGHQGWWVYTLQTGCGITLNSTWPTSALDVSGGIPGANFYTDQQWHHFVVTYNGSSLGSGVQIYIDGVAATMSVGTDTLTSSIIYSPTDPFEIGNRGNTQYFDGRMRDLAIWGKALSAADAAWLYNSGQPRDLYEEGYPGSLDGWWRLGDGDRFQEFYDSGPSANYSYVIDQSFSNYTGTMTNMEATDIVFDAPGHDGLSVMFDGVNEYAVVGNVLNFERTDPFSLSVWFKTTSTSDRKMICKRPASSPYPGYDLYLRDSGSITASLTSFSGNAIIVQTTLTGFNDGRWHHVAFCYDGSSLASGCTMVVDGVERALTVVTDALTASILTTAPLELGAIGTSQPFNGLMTHVAIYSKKLSVAEAQWVYNNKVPPDLTGVGAPSNLAAWWKCGNGDPYPTLLDSNPVAIAWPAIPDEMGVYGGTAVNMESGDVISDTPRGISTKALSLGGADEYITFGNVFGNWTNSYDNRSFSFWIRTAATSGYVFAKWDGVYSGYRCEILSDGKIRFWGNSGNNSITSNIAVNDGVWHHIVLVRFGTVYIDGVNRNGPSSGLQENVSTTVDFVVGNYAGGGSGTAFVGDIDEFAIYWAVGLSAAQVTWLYNSGRPRSLFDSGAPSGLTAWWRMGEGDVLNATMTNMESYDIVADYPVDTYYFAQKSLYFEGTNEYVDCGNNLGFDRTSPFTLSFWFRSTTSGCIIAKTDTASKGWLSELNGRITFMLNSVWTTNTLYVYTTRSNLKDGNWHHAVISYTGSSLASGVTIVIDGVEETLLVSYDNLTSSITTTGTVKIGYRNTGYPNAYIGNIDEVAVYGRALSVAEAQWIYNSGKPRDLKNAPGAPLKNLMAWWRMGEGGYRSSSANGTWQIRILGDRPGLTSNFAPRCLSFNGSKRVDMGNVLAFERTQPFSISCWARWVSTTYGALVAKTDSSNVGYALFKYLDYVAFEMRQAGGTSFGQAALVGLGNGAWHHIVATYDGSSTKEGSRVYIDGVDRSSGGSGTLTASIVTTATLRIGQRYSDLGFTGNIDEVAIYTKELTPTEVSWIFNSGVPHDLKATTAPSDLVGWWRLGEGAYPGAMTNMSITNLIGNSPGNSNFDVSSILFSGADEYVTMGDVLRFERTDAFSISLWFKTNADSNMYLVSKMGASPTFRGYGIYISAGALGFILQNDDSSINCIHTKTSNTYNDGTWHHVIFSYNGSGVASGVTSYIDGSSVSLSIISDGLTGTTITDANFTLGALPSVPSGYLTGSLDEVAVYDKALSEAEAQWIYNGYSPRDLGDDESPSNLVAWWRMGDGSYGNNGTMVNLEVTDITENAPRYPKIGGILINYFLMRGIDGLGSYQHWTVTGNPDFTGALAPTGPLYDITISASWSITS